MSEGGIESGTIGGMIRSALGGAKGGSIGGAKGGAKGGSISGAKKGLAVAKRNWEIAWVGEKLLRYVRSIPLTIHYNYI